MTCPVCGSGAEELPSHFLKECHGLSGIRENHEVKEEDKIELLLFCNWEKIEKRKKYLEDLWRERVKKQKYASPSADTKARLGIPSDQLRLTVSEYTNLVSKWNALPSKVMLSKTLGHVSFKDR